MNPSEWKNVGPGHYERDYGQGYAGTLRMVPSAPLGQQWEWLVTLGGDTLETGYRSNGADAGEAADECAAGHLRPKGYAALPGLIAAYEQAVNESAARCVRDQDAIRAAGVTSPALRESVTRDRLLRIASAMSDERRESARRHLDDAVRRALTEAAACDDDD